MTTNGDKTFKVGIEVPSVISQLICSGDSGDGHICKNTSRVLNPVKGEVLLQLGLKPKMSFRTREAVKT